MTERLKQRFQEYLDKNDGVFYPEQTADYFYNLALEDVMKEVEMRMTINRNSSKIFHSEAFAGRFCEDFDIREFIENLTRSHDQERPH